MKKKISLLLYLPFIIVIARFYHISTVTLLVISFVLSGEARVFALTGRLQFSESSDIVRPRYENTGIDDKLRGLMLVFLGYVSWIKIDILQMLACTLSSILGLYCWTTQA